LVLDRRDNLGPLPAEPLAVQSLNELGKRLLPGFLAVVVELAKLPGVQTELTRHLNMGMRQPVPLTGVLPGLQLRRKDRRLLAHAMRLAVHLANEAPFFDLPRPDADQIARLVADAI
jgi:hypothetical protein